MLVLAKPQLPRSRVPHSEVRRPSNRVALIWLALTSIECHAHSLLPSLASEVHENLLAEDAVRHG